MKERRGEVREVGALSFYVCWLDTEISNSFPVPPLLPEWSRELDSIPVRAPV